MKKMRIVRGEWQTQRLDRSCQMGLPTDNKFSGNIWNTQSFLAINTRLTTNTSYVTLCATAREQSVILASFGHKASQQVLVEVAWVNAHLGKSLAFRRLQCGLQWSSRRKLKPRMRASRTCKLHQKCTKLKCTYCAHNTTKSYNAGICDKMKHLYSNNGVAPPCE